VLNREINVVERRAFALISRVTETQVVKREVWLHLAKQEYDIIVIGAGSAGTASSLCCAEAGLKTLLLEALPLPRDKLCAGGVSPWVIKKLGIPEHLVERTIQQVQVVAGSKTIPSIPWPSDMAYRMVMRKEFDHFLVNKCLDAGVEVRDKTPISAVTKSRKGETTGVKTTLKEFRAKLVIGCDGASSVVARTTGLWTKWWTQTNTRRTWRKHQALCFETQMRLDPHEIEKRVGNTMSLFFERDFPGYHWIFPKLSFLTVGTLSFSPQITAQKIRERLTRIIHRHPVAYEALRGAKMGPLRGAYIPIRGPLSPSYSDGVMLAGDSAAQVGAIWGEGIYFATRAGIAAGETAVQATKNNDMSSQFLRKYEERWKQEIGANLEAQAKILRAAPTPLQATIAFAEYLVKNRNMLYP
jgi:digeranylgeranylglycerophospholipid reductase